jgi:hypothetical protein
MYAPVSFMLKLIISDLDGNILMVIHSPSEVSLPVFV